MGDEPPIDVAVTLIAFGFGAIVGSFLNVVAHRLPLDLSVVKPRSRCPFCRTPVRAVDNVPILSWIALGGRCRGCKCRISARYAVVELLTGLLAAHVTYVLVVAPGHVAPGRAWLHALVVFVLTAAMLAASLIDLDHRILPDRITKSGMWAAPAICAFLPELVLGSAGAPGWVPTGLPSPVQAAVVSLAGLAVGGGVIWSLGVLGSYAFGKEAMGFGDVKFLAMIGGFVGPGGALLALVLAAFVGALVGLGRAVITGDRYIPFGPFLAVGGYVVLLHGTSMVDWYLRYIGKLG